MALPQVAQTEITEVDITSWMRTSNKDAVTFKLFSFCRKIKCLIFYEHQLAFLYVLLVIINTFTVL